jgi:hypothetical protein
MRQLLEVLRNQRLVLFGRIFVGNVRQFRLVLHRAQNIMIQRKHRGKGVGLSVQLLGGDSIDTQGYHGHIGGLIRIEPYALFKVDKVLVAISAEKAGLVERGLARLAPKTNQWLYTATAEKPERDDWSVTVTAVRESPPLWTVGRESGAGTTGGARAGGGLKEQEGGRSGAPGADTAKRDGRLGCRTLSARGQEFGSPAPSGPQQG